ncbi:hypothetical protein GGI21_002039 [Coemansia aciculifera]|nr:hypothetical protein GGI21_002039 [Coemansia aciculifera]
MAGGGIGPQLPPEVAAMLGISANRHQQDSSDEASDSEAQAIGPAMPPPGALLTNPPAADMTTPDRITSNDNEDESNDDDDDLVGPSAALAGYSKEQALRQTIDMLEARTRKDSDDDTYGEGGNSKEKREEWMLVPPSAESTKAIKGSRGGGGPSGRNVNAAPLFDKSWTETPEEKRQRKDKEKTTKQSELLPIEEETPDMRRKREENEEKSKWVDEFNRTQRPKSLMEMHLESKSKGKRDRSDKSRRRDRERSPPSRRANNCEQDDDDDWKKQRFDRSRDLSAGKVDSKRQREMLNTMGFLSDKYAPSKGGSFN